MLWIIIAGVLLVFVGTALIAANDDERELLGVMFVVCGGILIGVAIAYHLGRNDSTTALDIYRGRTEVLRDTVAVKMDTVVVRNY